MDIISKDERKKIEKLIMDYNECNVDQKEELVKRLEELISRIEKVIQEEIPTLISKYF